MSDWRERARELLADGMSVNNVAREIGKSEFFVRQGLNLNGAADRYRARHRQKPPAAAANGTGRTAPLPRTISLAPVNLGPEPHVEPETERKVTPTLSVRAEKPGVSRIREIHQRMIRLGKIPDRDLFSEWRS